MYYFLQQKHVLVKLRISALVATFACPYVRSSPTKTRTTDHARLYTHHYVYTIGSVRN